jgi:hypothetical protein
VKETSRSRQLFTAIPRVVDSASLMLRRVLMITLLLALTASSVWAPDLRVSVVSLTSPAASSSDATLEIQTTPGASCAITADGKATDCWRENGGGGRGSRRSEQSPGRSMRYQEVEKDAHEEGSNSKVG